MSQLFYVLLSLQGCTFFFLFRFYFPLSFSLVSLVLLSFANCSSQTVPSLCQANGTFVNFSLPQFLFHNLMKAIHLREKNAIII